MPIPLPIIGLLVILRGRWAGVRFGNSERRRQTGAAFVRYEQHPAQPSHRVLFLGDSTVYGVGAPTPQQTVPGWFGQAFPTVAVFNRSRNRARMSECQSLLVDLAGQPFDAIVVMGGGNDIVVGTSAAQLERDLKHLLVKLQSMTQTVLLVHQGNLGNVPLLPTWLQPIFTRRSRMVRQVMRQTANDLSIGWLDFFVEASHDHWRRQPDHYYSPDWFHPGGEGYREWAERIASQLRHRIA